MRAGASRVDITPPVGTALAGYFSDRKASGVHDPLYAKALAVESGDEAAAILACDLICLYRETVQQIRSLAQRKSGIPAERIMVACTHTHLGPATVDIFQTAADRAYLERLVPEAAEAVSSACGRMRPASLSIASGELHGVAFNRRYRLADGAVMTNPGRRPDIVGPAGPVDPQVAVLAFTGEDGRPIALLVNFACHLDTIGGDVVSADYPGFMAAVVRDSLGEDVEVVFVNGACGDVNHIDLSDASPPKGFDMARSIGERLAAKVLETLSASRRTRPARMERVLCASDVLRLEVRAIPEQELERARSALATAPPLGSYDHEQVYAREAILVSELAREVEAEIQEFCLGEAALVGAPFEMFCELGLAIKAASPFQPTMVVELANGYEGYLPTRKAYQEGGYETRAARSSKLSPGSGEAVVECATGLLRRLRARAG